MRVVQVVERIHDRERRKVVRAEIAQPGDAQLDESGAEVRPREQRAREQNRVAVSESRLLRNVFMLQSVKRERVAARREGQNDEDVNRGHLVVVEVAEAPQQPLVEKKQKRRRLRRETRHEPDRRRKKRRQKKTLEREHPGGSQQRVVEAPGEDLHRPGRAQERRGRSEERRVGKKCRSRWSP